MIKAYKGFDENMQCRGFQYEVGKEYEEEQARLCNRGFHACEYPLDVFSYYNPATSKFCEVELDDVSGEKHDDSKRVGKKIKIGAEIGIKELVEASVNFIMEKIDNTKSKNEDNFISTNTGDYSASTNTGDRSASTNTGNYSASTNTGDCSASTNTGDRSASTNTGDYSASTVSGKHSVAIATGYKGKAKACKGSAICLVERDYKGDILNIKAEIIDGIKLKENVFYTLVNGEFKEVED